MLLPAYLLIQDLETRKSKNSAYANWNGRYCHESNLAKAIFEDHGYDVEIAKCRPCTIFVSMSGKKADVFLGCLDANHDERL